MATVNARIPASRVWLRLAVLAAGVLILGGCVYPGGYYLTEPAYPPPYGYGYGYGYPGYYPGPSVGVIIEGGGRGGYHRR